ncbi:MULTISPECIES: hypothetical protein [Cryobacterium]|uniref:Helix-turn-helix domain-containing protein n=1 Tax=Cryobacterium breve TaxID=1259258 RepID=A0ABY2JCC6_9MICO|nr:MULTISPECIES: hypothetical protein [Cryobacterium]TFC94507.1 hypothetical protein E3T20_08400 [Cryobacterium sp. TmT3-12]TFD01983.1 hypothetical protein E3O65_00320 [Cryobacterium breve]
MNTAGASASLGKYQSGLEAGASDWPRVRLRLGWLTAALAFRKSAVRRTIIQSDAVSHRQDALQITPMRRLTTYGRLQGSEQHRLSEVLFMASKVVIKEHENLFWDRVLEGMSAATACESMEVNRKQVYRWIKAAGGRIPVPAGASSGRYFGQEEHLRIAGPRLGCAGVRAIEWDLGRSASTIGRELRRNSHPTTRSYRPYAAQKHCVIRVGRPKPSKLDDRLLAAVVEERLRKNWSPQ